MMVSEELIARLLAAMDDDAFEETNGVLSAAADALEAAQAEVARLEGEAKLHGEQMAQQMADCASCDLAKLMQIELDAAKVENTRLREESYAYQGDALMMTGERDAALAKLKRLEEQEPWCYHWEDRWGCNHYADPKEPIGPNAKPLYLAAGASPEPSPTAELSDKEVRQAAELAAVKVWPNGGHVGWTDEDTMFYGEFSRAIIAAILQLLDRLEAAEKDAKRLAFILSDESDSNLEPELARRIFIDDMWEAVTDCDGNYSQEEKRSAIDKAMETK